MVYLSVLYTLETSSFVKDQNSCPRIYIHIMNVYATLNEPFESYNYS